MHPDERLRSPRDFAAIRSRGRAVHCATLTLSWLAAQPEQNRFGFVVSKRVGNAVTRNLVKRRLRAIMQGRRTELRAGYDIALTARPAAAQRAFADLARDVDSLLRRAQLMQPATAALTPTPPDPEGGSA